MLKFEDYPHHVDQIFAAALEAAEPQRAVRRVLRWEERGVCFGDKKVGGERGRILVISVGKAAVPMAEAALDILGDKVDAAALISKQGGLNLASKEIKEDPRVRLLAGDHPVSGQNSVQSTAETVALLEDTTPDDLVLCLISGGASALFTLPVISLADWQGLLSTLLASGCTIDELNTVRRQLDRVKGGGLLHLAAPATCASLILSDVVGNPLEVIGSGPTVLFSESPSDALAILERYDVAAATGVSAFERIREALQEEVGKELVAVEAGEIVIVGDVRTAASAALEKSCDLGFESQVLTVHLEGEAREVGRVAAALAKDAKPDSCLILGGETTVTIRGNGRGGRNQETALSAAIALDGWPGTAVASLATDGEDGPTLAAGAIAAGWTASAAYEHGLVPHDYLERNDSFTFFSELDKISANAANLPASLVLVGSTGTNVNDLILILTYSDSGSGC